MALRTRTAFSGTPKLARAGIKERIADSVVEYFRVSNQKVCGAIAEAGLMKQPKPWFMEDPKN